ncbi:phosphatase PAP2 family protein [Aureimonas sp. Leaf454]|uniref:phosphatase PAP2 family protein n=1 Tax=Aureimonas sp. Leaf454 TaxID=1736381 RepID=UPI00138F35FB|nr:phosphatase PAP2 family protein [Aureimonas sp. Leaf454]
MDASAFSSPVVRHPSLPAWASDSFRSVGFLPVVVGVQLATILSLQVVYTELPGFDLQMMLESIVFFLLVALPICVVAICFGRILKARPSGSATVALLADIKAVSCDRGRAAMGWPVIALFIPFMSIFAQFKTMIPLIRPFDWDETFVAWDRALSFGALPHEILAPVMSHPVPLMLTNVAYNLWFFFMLGGFIGFAFAQRPSALRTRYLTAFFLVWFVEGSLLALVFSSAGPCFYGLLGLPADPYQPLLESLRAAGAVVPLFSLTTQDLLWSGYVGQGDSLGISAMPSLHNAMAVLMALAARHLGRRLGWAFAAYAVWIFVGSIALAWHYAVDGLVALPVTLALWMAAGRIARWWHREDAAEDRIAATAL